MNLQMTGFVTEERGWKFLIRDCSFVSDLNGHSSDPAGRFLFRSYHWEAHICNLLGQFSLQAKDQTKSRAVRHPGRAISAASPFEVFFLSELKQKTFQGALKTPVIGLSLQFTFAKYITFDVHYLNVHLPHSFALNRDGSANACFSVVFYLFPILRRYYHFVIFNETNF